MNELAAADGHADVRGAAADRLEEQKIARFDVVHVDGRAGVVLLAHFARQRRPELREHVLHETAAIKAGGIASAVPVGHTLVLQGGTDERGRRGRRRKFRGGFDRARGEGGAWEGARDTTSRGAGAVQNGHRDHTQGQVSPDHVGGIGVTHCVH